MDGCVGVRDRRIQGKSLETLCLSWETSTYTLVHAFSSVPVRKVSELVARIRLKVLSVSLRVLWFLPV